MNISENLIAVNPNISANENLFNLCKSSRPDIEWDENNKEDYIFTLVPNKGKTVFFQEITPLDEDEDEAAGEHVTDHRERLPSDFDLSKLGQYLHPSELKVEKRIPLLPGEPMYFGNEETFPESELIATIKYYRPVFTNVIWNVLHNKYANHTQNRSDDDGYDLDVPFLSLPLYNSVAEDSILLPSSKFVKGIEGTDLVVRKAYDLQSGYENSLNEEDSLVDQFNKGTLNKEEFFKKLLKLYGHPDSDAIRRPTGRDEINLHVDERLFVAAIDRSSDTDDSENTWVIKKSIKTELKDYTA